MVEIAAFFKYIAPVERFCCWAQLCAVVTPGSVSAFAVAGFAVGSVVSTCAVAGFVVGGVGSVFAVL